MEDERFVLVQKMSDSLEEPQKVEAIRAEYCMTKVQLGAEMQR